MCFLRVKHWDGGDWGKLVRWEVNSGALGVTRPTAQGLACGREVSAVEALGKLRCLDGHSVMRKPAAKPRQKVPAPQANGVAARLRPPPEARAGGGSGYDHPSPSIPLPVEGRGKPVASRPAGLETLATV